MCGQQRSECLFLLDTRPDTVTFPTGQRRCQHYPVRRFFVGVAPSPRATCRLTLDPAPVIHRGAPGGRSDAWVRGRGMSSHRRLSTVPREPTQRPGRFGRRARRSDGGGGYSIIHLWEGIATPSPPDGAPLIPGNLSLDDCEETRGAAAAPDLRAGPRRKPPPRPGARTIDAG